MELQTFLTDLYAFFCQEFCATIESILSCGPQTRYTYIYTCTLCNSKELSYTPDFTANQKQYVLEYHFKNVMTYQKFI